MSIEASLARDNKAALSAYENYSVWGQSVTKFSNEMNKRIEGCFSWIYASFQEALLSYQSSILKTLSFICNLNGAQMSGRRPIDFNQSTWITCSMQNDEENKMWGEKHAWIKRQLVIINIKIRPSYFSQEKHTEQTNYF